MKETERPVLTENCCVSVDGQIVKVSEELYYMLRADKNSVRHRARVEHRCGTFDHRKCIGDCYECPFHRDGPNISYSVLSETMDDIPMFADKCVNVEEQVLLSETIADVYHYADRLEKYGAEILQMAFAEQMSVWEIGFRLGVSHMTVSRKLKRLVKKIRENRHLFL